jgi:hypothetical protein
MRWCETVRERVLYDGFAASPAGRLDWSVFRYGRPAAKRVLRRPLASWLRPDRASKTRVQT